MILVTGSAGFVGYHVSLRLLQEGQTVHGVDNLNGYYDVALKEARNARLQALPGYSFQPTDLSDATAAAAIFAATRPELVIHLAAQAGVRHSLSHPRAYADSNLIGFLNVLEGCRARRVGHLVYASSSSVYGLNEALPFSVHQATEHPVSFYAATKKANELMAHSYSHLFGLPTTGLRLFTVYGPWGRPDMAYWLFTNAIMQEHPIPVFGEGKLMRDFTFIDDIIAVVTRIVETPFQMSGEGAPHRLYNLGNSHPESVLGLVGAIESATGRKATIERAEGPPGDVRETYADISRAARDFGFAPKTVLRDGIARFVDWFEGYNGLR